MVPLADLGGYADMIGSGIRFSPEGDQILFSRTATADPTSLWSVRPDGSDLHRLVAGSEWGDWQTLAPTR